jgi:hypothetical protein
MVRSSTQCTTRPRRWTSRARLDGQDGGRPARCSTSSRGRATGRTNTWELYENIVDDELINDYEARQCEAEEEAAAEEAALQLLTDDAQQMDIDSGADGGVYSGADGGGANGGGTDAPSAAAADAPTVVEAAQAEEATLPQKILKHQYYANKAGGLACVWVQLLYADGTKTNGVVASEPLAASEAGRSLLKAYVASKKGAKIAKPF